MSGWQCFWIEAEINDPEGWIINVGNSYSNNGGGGDSGDFTNDSELEITFDEELVPESEGQGLLRVFDNGYNTQVVPVLKIGDFISEHKSIVQMGIGDQCVNVTPRNVALQSENVFRLGGADDEAGVNDYLYWVGLPE